MPVQIEHFIAVYLHGREFSSVRGRYVYPGGFNLESVGGIAVHHSSLCLLLISELILSFHHFFVMVNLEQKERLSG